MIGPCELASTRAIAFYSPSPSFSLAANLILALRAIILFVFEPVSLFSTQAKGRRLICWSRPSIPLIFFLCPPPPPPLAQPSFFSVYLANHAPTNTSPLPLPRVRLDPSRAGCISTNIPRLDDGDALASPGERRSAQSDSGHSDSADDQYVRLSGSLGWPSILTLGVVALRGLSFKHALSR